jgi:hypothetical protein
MECIICLTDGSEPLQENRTCPCKYKRHNSCWIDYVHSVTVVKCPMCRHDLSQPLPKTPLIQGSVQPVTRQEFTEIQRNSPGQSITYEEFVEIVRVATEVHEAQGQEQIQREEAQREKQKCKKVAGILVCSAILCSVFLILFKFL